MGFDVKNTTKISILDMLCPYTCRGCGHMGELFCECCKNYIKPGGLKICPNCKKDICDCKMPFKKTVIVGFKDGGLEKLVEDYKYRAIRGAAKVIAELLDGATVLDEKNVTVVPLPTTHKHVRERGFDHTLKIAKELAGRRKWRCEKKLRRLNNTVQVGTDKKTRITQANKAYEVVGEIDENTTYLLIDDVWTTGASMLAAAEKMRESGATKIDMAVVMIGR